MTTIRIQYRDDFEELETFKTVEQAKMCEPVSKFRSEGYAVLFQYEDRFAVFVAYEDRFYYQYLPSGSKVLFAGLWLKHKIVDWQPASNMSKSEREIFGGKFTFLYDED